MKAKLGFIGAGWWATSNHMPELSKRTDVEMAAVCRLGADELQKVKKEFNFHYATEDYTELLAIEDLDGVVVASPHTLHYEHALAALRKGLHVMCEKPLCTTASDARILVSEAQSRGLHLIVPHGWHFTPFIQEAKKRMDEGAVGEVEYILCHMASPIRELLKGERFEYEMGSMFMPPEPSTWADPKIAGGGYGLAQISHSASMAFWLTGLVPSTVHAFTSAPGSRVELYDAMSVKFACGAIGIFSGAGTIPSDRGFQLDIRIFGSDGVLSLDIDRARLQILRHDGDHYEADLPLDAGNYACDGPPNNFADLILGKTDTNWAPGSATMRSVELLDAAYRSSESGKPENV